MSFIGKNPQLTTIKFNARSSAPSTPTEGMIYYDDGTTNSEGFYKYQNSVWEPIGSNADYMKLNSKAADPSTPAEGQFFYANGTSRPEGLYVYNGSEWLQVQLGTSGINYISNSSFEGGTTGWSLYADAAQPTPENGTAGSATSTFSASSSSPLRGLKSLVFSKPASNEQGEGFSYDFTIDSADKNNVLEISFDYDASNANYLDDFMSIFIYDVTNSQLIRFNGEELKGKTNGKFLAFFQASSSTSYRLIAHVVTATTTAWDVKFDNFFVGPSKDVSISNTNITTWTSYTPTTQSFGTLTNQNFQWRRNGQNIEIMGYFTIGTTTATESRIYLPNSYTSLSTLPTVQTCGTLTWSISGNPHLHLFPLIEASKTYFVFGYIQTTGSQLTKQTDPTGIGMNGSTVSFLVSIPIKEFSAADTTNSEYSGRFQTCTLRLTSDQTISTSIGMKLAFATVVKDTASMADTSLNRIYARESGFYDLDFGASGSALDINEKISVDIYVNSVIYRSGGVDSSGDNQFWSTSMTLKSIELIKGDYVEVYVNSDSDSSYTASGDSGLSWFTLTKTNPPVEMVKSNETVYLEYYGNDGDTYSSSPHDVKWKTKVEDSHGAWNGTQFTTPITGDYIIEGSCNRNASSTYNIFAKIGGTALSTNPELTQNGITTTLKKINRVIRLTKNQILSFEFDSTGHTISNTIYHRICIRKLN